MMRILSWGRGVQSTTLAALSALGKLEPLDAVLHADTGWERQATYEVGDWYSGWLARRGVCSEVLTGQDIWQEGAVKHIRMPFWTSEGGPLCRECTGHFKVEKIKRRSRELAGYNATAAPHPPADTIELWIGISADEWQRAKPSRVQFTRHRFPLLELRMTRADCISFLESEGLPVPVKSACIGCPYRRASEYLDLTQDEFAQAVEFDECNRCIPSLQRDGDSDDRTYIYRDPLHGPIALADADLQRAAAEERNRPVQLPLFIPGWPE